MKAFVKDRLTVRILKSRAEMGKAAARDVAAEMRRLLAQRAEISLHHIGEDDL